jgi:hypothetical protein
MAGGLKTCYVPGTLKDFAMRPLIFVALVLATPTAFADKTEPKISPPGERPSAKTHVLKSGAAVLQTDAPVTGMDVYLVGFHAMKDHAGHQMEAHHFCKQVNEEFAQCTIFDGNTSRANLVGIEYIISEKLFEGLTENEKKLWHPHNYEILSGQLIAPNIPGPVEKELFKGKMNSYGKTWHVWATGQGQRMPIGEPMLAWSFNQDGEARPGMVEDRDKRFGVSTSDKRKARQDLTELAKPQSGVDDMKGQFGRATRPLAGVVDKSNAQASTQEEGAAGSSSPSQQRSQEKAQPDSAR